MCFTADIPFSTPFQLALLEMSEIISKLKDSKMQSKAKMRVILCCLLEQITYGTFSHLFVNIFFSHGHARTQVMLVPRALKQKTPQTQSKSASVSDTQIADAESSTKTQTSDGSSSSETGKKTTGMSNSDFRNLLLKK